MPHRRGTGDTVLWIAASLLCVAYGAVGALVWAETRGHLVYGLDDAYIHMAIARNLAEHGSFGINAGEFNAAASSVAWPLLIAGVYRVVGVKEVAPLAFNVIFSIALLAVLAREFRRFRPEARPSTRLAMLAAVVLAAGVPKLVYTGLEHPLHILATTALVAVAARTAASPSHEPRARTLLLCALAFATTAARFEGVFAVGVVSVLFGLRRRLGSGAAIAAAGAVPPLGFAIVSLWNGGHLVPNSVMLKGVSTGVDFLEGVVASRGADLLLPFASGRFATVLAICSVAVLWQRRRRGVPVREAGQLLLASAAAIALGHVLLVRAPERYEGYVIALVVFALFAAPPIGLRGVLRWRRGSPLPLVEVMVVGLLLLVVLGGAKRGLDGIERVVPASVNIYEQQYQMGTFLRDYHSGTVVAANDIGAINFLADVECIDLWGLANDEVLQARLEHRYDTRRIAEIVASRRGEIAIVYESWFERFGGLPGHWVEVGEWSVAERHAVADETVSFYATDPAVSEALMQSLVSMGRRLPPTVRQSGRYVDRVRLAARPAGERDGASR